MMTDQPRYLWPTWHGDLRLAAIVATFEQALEDRLSVAGITNTGVPLLRIVSARSQLRRKARKIGLVWGRWPTDDGRHISAWLPNRPKKFDASEAYEPSPDWPYASLSQKSD